MNNDAIEAALLSGEFARELEDLFGSAEYAELRQLAQQAQRGTRRGGRKVLILPGIMGSKLGEPKKFLGLIPTDDVYWLDPFDVARGRLERLAMTAGRDIKPLGVFLIAYARLKYRLGAEGFDVDYYPYDWRRGIAELGRGLMQHLQKLGPDVSLVAHSMGGLVARAAFRHGAKFDRLIQLGSPNHGSYAPLLALRGVDDSVKKIAALDLTHGRSELINRIFRGFQGLVELLPSLPEHSGTRFFDWNEWPRDKSSPEGERFLAPSQQLLKTSSKIQDALGAVPTAKWTLIAGVRQSTVTGATYDPGQDAITYTYSDEGDGTVPLAFARVADVPTYYVEESHGQLANNKMVARAVADILDHGATNVLADQPPASRRGARTIREDQLRAVDPYADVRPTPVVRGEAPDDVRSYLQMRDLRNVLSGYLAAGAATPPATLAAAGGETDLAPMRATDLSADATPWKRLVVGRARQHRLEVQLANCSITQVGARAYVLGLFSEVTPTGAASFIDRRLDGAVTEFMNRRMFSGGVGEVFILPANRSRLPADMVLFAGLGYFDRFNGQVLQTTAENVLRTFVRTRVEDFATVLFGGGSGNDVRGLLVNLLRGFVRGKLDADVDHHFRRITLCETDGPRYQAIRDALYEIAGTPLFEDVEVTFTELPKPPEEALVERAAAKRPEDPVYLIVRREREDRGQLVYGSSILTAGSKASILTASGTVQSSELEKQLEAVTGRTFGVAAGRRLGEFLATQVLGESIRLALPRMKGRHLVIVHDAPTSRIPWETLRLGDWEPALLGGMSRRYMAENLSVAKYMQVRPAGTSLNVLLVVNPTGDLDGADAEGKVVAQLMHGRGDVRLKQLDRAHATRKAVLGELASGQYDLVHYAGHAFFDQEVPERSGLLCAGEEVLTGNDLSAIGNLPRLVFFNACESGRVRRGIAPHGVNQRKLKLPAAVRRSERVAPAEAFLRGGIANFLGTYWPVGDAAAERFSGKFYAELLAGQPIGGAILAARNLVRDSGSVDWSDYIHYGDFAFTVRERRDT